jgi:hypothetical protein
MAPNPTTKNSSITLSLPLTKKSHPSSSSPSSSSFTKLNKMAFKEREALSGLDNFFCLIESPQNLMSIAGLWFFDGPPDMLKVRECLQRMTERFPRFHKKVSFFFFFFFASSLTIILPPFFPSSSQVIEGEKGNRWFEDYAFSLDDHIIVEDLNDDEEALRHSISKVMSLPLSEKKALWEAHVFTGVHLPVYSSSSSGITSFFYPSPPSPIFLILLLHLSPFSSPFFFFFLLLK